MGGMAFVWNPIQREWTQIFINDDDDHVCLCYKVAAPPIYFALIVVIHHLHFLFLPTMCE